MSTRGYLHTSGIGTWTQDEHERFLVAIQKYPLGPWRKVAEVVKTRSVRQTQSHALKFRAKLKRQEQQARLKEFLSGNLDLTPLPFPEPDHLTGTPPAPSLTEALDFLMDTMINKTSQLNY